VHKRLSRHDQPDVLARLADVYREVEREPVPQRFLDLIERLSSDDEPGTRD
jgi:hypothetical protein